MNVRYSPQAFLDLEDGLDFYLLRSEIAANDFLAAVEFAIDEAVRTPERFARYEGSPDIEGLRRNFVRQFPYFVVYRILADAIEIVAIAHASREPGYWKKSD